METNKGNLRREQDKFYTAPHVVKKTIDILSTMLSGLNIPSSEAVAIEPSAGGGAFLGAIKRMGFGEVRAFDIAPEGPGIETRDFLESLIETDEQGRPMIFIGNPPFGSRAGLAIDFVNHSFASGATLVAFILPVQMRKWISQKAVTKGTKLLVDVDLPADSFIFNDKPYNVRSCFQIWATAEVSEGMQDLRIHTRPEINHADFEMWQYNCTKQAEHVFDKDWDFAVLRQGYGDYNIRHEPGATLDRKKQWILFKAANADALERLRGLDFDALSKTNTSVRGFGKTEVVAEYRRQYEGVEYGTQTRSARDNQILLEAISDLRRFTRSNQAGHSLDDAILDALSEKTGFPIVRPDEFKRNYAEFKAVCALAIESGFGVFDFRSWHNLPLESGVKKTDGLIISQPNGSQQYPDILVIKNGMGIPIEIKSGKEDKILWNSALPRIGGIYIHNRYRKDADTTFFLGEHAISPEDEATLRQMREALEEVVAKGNDALSEGGPWSMYPRPMHNCSEKFLSHPDRQERENDVLMRVKDLMEGDDG